MEEHTHEKHGPKHGEPCPGCDNTIFLVEFSKEKCVGFQCNLCKFEFKIPDHIKDVFIDNKKTNIPDKVYICGECKLAFPSKEKINEHKHENTSKSLVCKNCNIPFDKIQQLYEHSLKEHNVGPLNEKGSISKGNLFLNVLAHQMDTIVANFQQVLHELANIKRDMKETTSKKAENCSNDDNGKLLLETVDARFKELEKAMKIGQTKKDEPDVSNASSKEKWVKFKCDMCDYEAARSTSLVIIKKQNIK